MSLSPRECLLLSPSGEAAFGPCSPPLAAARSSSGRDPAARLAAGSLAVLLPRVEPLGRSQRLPAAMRALGPCGLRSNRRFTRGADGMPPTHHLEVVLRSRVLAKPKAIGSASAKGRVGTKPPSGRRPISPERAGPERASRGGVSLATPERSGGGEQRGAPPRDALLGRTRRRVGGRRSMRRPSDTAVGRGAKRKASRSERREPATPVGRGVNRVRRRRCPGPPRRRSRPPPTPRASPRPRPPHSRGRAPGPSRAPTPGRRGYRQ